MPNTENESKVDTLLNGEFPSEIKDDPRIPKALSLGVTPAELLYILSSDLLSSPVIFNDYLKARSRGINHKDCIGATNAGMFLGSYTDGRDIGISHEELVQVFTEFKSSDYLYNYIINRGRGDAHEDLLALFRSGVAPAQYSRARSRTTYLNVLEAITAELDPGSYAAALLSGYEHAELLEIPSAGCPMIEYLPVRMLGLSHAEILELARQDADLLVLIHSYTRHHDIDRAKQDALAFTLDTFIASESNGR